VSLPDSYLIFGRAEREGAKAFSHVKAFFPAIQDLHIEESIAESNRPWIYLDFSSEAPYIFPFWHVDAHIKIEVNQDPENTVVLSVPTVAPEERKPGDAHRYFFARTCATEVSSALGLGRHLGFLRGHVLPLTPRYLAKRLLKKGVARDLTERYAPL